MTGGQTNPGNERTLAGAETKPVDIAGICRALGVEQIEVVDPYDYEACLAALKAGLAYDGPAVIITNRPCMLFPSKIGGEAFTVDEDVCNACQQCMKLGCPSLSHTEAEHKGRHKVRIDEETCTGCSLCAAALQAGGHLEGEGRCGMSADEAGTRRGRDAAPHYRAAWSTTSWSWASAARASSWPPRSSPTRRCCTAASTSS